MLAFTSDLRACNIEAVDGEMGKVKDLYFDDRHWAVRYVQIDTWKTLPGRRVLLSPASFGPLDLAARLLHVHLNKETIKKSPDYPETFGFSLERENELADYYGWSKYWTGSMVWGTGAYPVMSPIEERITEEIQNPTVETDPLSSVHNLRSEEKMLRYRVHAADGRLGEVVDAIFDTETWTIQSLVVKLRLQPETGLILISPQELSSAEWVEGDLYGNGTRAHFKERPIYQSEKELHEYLPNL